MCYPTWVGGGGLVMVGPAHWGSPGLVLVMSQIQAQTNFHSGNVSRPETRPESSQSRMPVLSRDRNAQDGKFPGFFPEKSGSWEMAFRNADL